MNFFKFHQQGKPTLVNLDNVKDISTRSGSDNSIIYYSEEENLVVDETLEQIYKLIKCGEEVDIVDAPLLDFY